MEKLLSRLQQRSGEPPSTTQGRGEMAQLVPETQFRYGDEDVRKCQVCMVVKWIV